MSIFNFFPTEQTDKFQVFNRLLHLFTVLFLSCLSLRTQKEEEKKNNKQDLSQLDSGYGKHLASG